MIEKQIAGSVLAFFGGLQNFVFSRCLKMIPNGGKDFFCGDQGLIGNFLSVELVRITAGDSIWIAGRDLVKVKLPGMVQKVF